MTSMPFCENCARFQESDSVGRKGECPTCGAIIAPPKKAPWHFKLLIVATIIYLLYRFIQLILWILKSVGH